MLAIHGLTGYGGRWRQLGTHVPDIAVAAPDLIGHGRSSWAAPWTIDANVAALGALLDTEADAPVLVVGHSFGGAIAMHLAAAHPDHVAALLLLDPAIGLDGDRMREIADAMLSSPDYPGVREARMEKATGSWAEVDPAVLDADLDEHLVKLPSGRYAWRVSLPAMMSYWSELARDIVLPLVRAARNFPPYVTDSLVKALRQQLGSDLDMLDFDCDHMVSESKPSEVAALIRKLLQAS
jgi:lipase